MKYFYDLHIHSALSPCGDVDMTPNNIVNMSLIKGLDIIAVADHNSIKNVSAVMKCAEGTGLVVVPAMEIESSEEVHLLALFPDLKSAEKVYKIIYNNMLGIKNKSEVFGEQIIYDSSDQIIGYEENLLVSALKLSITDIKNIVDRAEGVLIPAHIDRNSFSVISNLGSIPDIGFTAVEISKNADINDYKDINYNIISNSDAHYLEDISEQINVIELSEKNVENLLSKLRKIY